jgi:hypothetical protein
MSRRSLQVFDPYQYGSRGALVPSDRFGFLRARPSEADNAGR